MRPRLIFALSLVGIFNSAYLLWTYTSPSRPMLCLGTGCDEVRASSFAVLWGLPLPLYGLLMYGALALVAMGVGVARPLFGTRSPLGRSALHAIALISGAGFLVSLVLTAIEAFVIHAWCIWCVVSAVVVTLIFGLAVLEVRKPAAVWVSGPEDGGKVGAVARSYLAVLGVAALISVPAWMFLTRPGEPLDPREVAESNLSRLHRPDSHWQGPGDAELVIVEFADLECASCARIEPVIERVRKTYGEKIRYTLRHFPLTRVHAHSWKAAEAAECAAEQGKYWDAVAVFFDHQQDLRPEALKGYAGQIGLDGEAFSQCLDSGRMAERVRKDREDGEELGVRGTPTFFVGHRAVSGQISYDQFARMIEVASAQVITATAQLSEPPDEKVMPGTRPDAEENSTSAPAAPDADLTHGASGGENPETVSFPSTGSDALLTVPASLGGGDNPSASFGGSFGSCSEDLPPEPPRIGMEETYGLFSGGNGVVFLDVRDPDQFRAAHIRGAMNLPVTQAEAGLSSLPKDRKIVIYGQSTASGDPCAESRSTGRLLLANGVAENLLAVFADGFEAWVEGGHPIEKGP